MTDIKFNLNDCVKVKLSDKGLELMRKEHEEFEDVFAAKRGGKRKPFTPPPVDKDGYSTWQLWHLMQTFGKHISLGLRTPFEDGNIIFTTFNYEPKSATCGACHGTGYLSGYGCGTCQGKGTVPQPVT